MTSPSGPWDSAGHVTRTATTAARRPVDLAPTTALTPTTDWHSLEIKIPMFRRKEILAQLGIERPVSRASWSHDCGHSIVFDAWEHRWELDEHGRLVRYLMRSNGEHYNLSKDNSKGHIRWQKHVDLVLDGERDIRAIMPVAIEPYSGKGAKGWLPLMIEGHLELDGENLWLYADSVIKLEMHNN